MFGLGLGGGGGGVVSWFCFVFLFVCLFRGRIFKNINSFLYLQSEKLQ